jgi:hypothetical protein
VSLKWKQKIGCKMKQKLGSKMKLYNFCLFSH